ncbi:MAG: 4-hydroxyproline epimerase [Acidobacteria bacterium]|nr:4-hydroxyproline epimerase [Acidobacteriota bacterium]
MRRVQVIDSHTGGEPTRLVVAGGPGLGNGTMAERLTIFRDHHDDFRSAVVNEPRGSDVIVGALLCEPVNSACAAGVIFFNNVGYLGMCGHGTIGLMVTLGHMGRITPGEHRIETPVGEIRATLLDAATVSLDNVPSYRHRTAVTVDVAGLGPITGDVAWGGNWFFLVTDHGQRIALDNVEQLTDVTWRIRQALNAGGITGEAGGEIDHIELFDGNRNFVLCPGKAYDRSPCGTGTSAKLACLAASGKLAEGEVWRQESIVDSVFEGSYRRAGDRIIPTIRGTAYVNAEATLILNPADPYCMGIRR